MDPGATTVPGHRQISGFCRDHSGAACRRCGQRILSRSFVANVVGPVVKGFFGVLVGSQSLIADAVHSSADAVAFGVNYAGSRESRITPFTQSVVIATLTFLAGVWVYATNIALLLFGEPAHPGLLGPVIAAVSAAVNFYLYSVAACVARRDPGTTNDICALQNKTNCYASCLAFGGMMLAEIGWPSFDPLCAVLIGFLLFTSAFEIFKQAFAGHPDPTRAKMIVVLVIVLSSFGIAGYVVHTTRGGSDVVLVPATADATNSPVDGLLGRASYFIVFDAAEETVVPIRNNYRNYRGDVSDALLKIVRVKQVDVVLAKKVGAEIFRDLSREGVRIYYVDHRATAAQALVDFRAGRLKRARAPNVGRGFGRRKKAWLSPW